MMTHMPSNLKSLAEGYKELYPEIRLSHLANLDEDSIRILCAPTRLRTRVKWAISRKWRSAWSWIHSKLPGYCDEW